MPCVLLTWSDRGALVSRLGHHIPRGSSDRGPVLRLLDQEESRNRYDVACILTTPTGQSEVHHLEKGMSTLVGRVQLSVLDVSDPSDHGQLFRALGPFVDRFDREFPADTWDRDVLLSAGTPQAQTLWVILVQAGLLRARMLQVIPSAFVPHPHPRAIREVHLDIEGFPEIRALRDEVARLRAAVRLSTGSIVGVSAKIQQMLSRLARVAAADVPVLILGETGTGKELVARAIHESSARAEGPFVAENCGAFAEGLLASELFGHEVGAFTGATKLKRGLFEQAHGGTLFLDEVGEMEGRVQTHLLRVLQDGTLRRVGGEKPVKVDVRIIAATHRPLEQLVREGSFRDDLYYRLRGAELHVPPLRDRKEDIPMLVEHFLQDLRRPVALSITPDAMDALLTYSWPGNVRELRSEVVRWGVFCDRKVDRGDLPHEIREAAKSRSGCPSNQHAVPLSSLAESVRAAERSTILAALDQCRGNLSQTARLLQIDRNTLKRKLTSYGKR